MPLYIKKNTLNFTDNIHCTTNSVASVISGGYTQFTILYKIFVKSLYRYIPLPVSSNISFIFFRAMFTDDLLESQLDEIRLNGVTALGMKKLIDFAYSSKIVIDTGI